MSEKQNKAPYIFKYNYTIIIYIIIVLVSIYNSYKVYQYDMKVESIKVKRFDDLFQQKDKIKFISSLNDYDKELLEMYISHIIDKKKREGIKFNKITSSFKNSFVTGFITSSLSGAPIHYNVISGITMGSVNAFYKSIINNSKSNINGISLKK